MQWKVDKKVSGDFEYVFGIKRRARCSSCLVCWHCTTFHKTCLDTVGRGDLLWEIVYSNQQEQSSQNSLTEWKNNCGCKHIAAPVRKQMFLKFYVNQNFFCAFFCANCWIIVSEWGMVRTKARTAFLCNNFYNTLENKRGNNEGGEQSHKIIRNLYSFWTDFWKNWFLNHYSFET